jgi:hypothetical protein
MQDKQQKELYYSTSLNKHSAVKREEVLPQ